MDDLSADVEFAAFFNQHAGFIAQLVLADGLRTVAGVEQGGGGELEAAEVLGGHGGGADLGIGAEFDGDAGAGRGLGGGSRGKMGVGARVGAGFRARVGLGLLLGVGGAHGLEGPGLDGQHGLTDGNGGGKRAGIGLDGHRDGLNCGIVGDAFPDAGRMGLGGA